MSTSKRISALILLIIFSFSLSACYRWYLLAPVKYKEVSKIELVNYSNPTVKDNPLEKYPLDLEKIEILEALDANDIDSFLDKLSQIDGPSSINRKVKKILNSPNGIGVKMTYSDDSFTLITVTVIKDKDSIFLGHYDIYANLESCFGISWQEMIDDFQTLIDEYFNMTKTE